MFAIAEKRIGVCLSVGLCVASIIGLSLPNDATAQEPTLHGALKPCSKVEVERMIKKGSSPTCAGSFSAATQEEIEQALKLNEEIEQALKLESDQEVTDAIENESGLSPQGIFLYCGFKAEGDYAHISATGTDVSAHGWWDITVNFGCPAQSTVNIVLMGYWRTSPTSGYFVEVGNDTRVIGTAQATGQNATARRACEQTKFVTFYSHVHATLGDGSNRTSNKTTPTRDLYCNPI